MGNNFGKLLTKYRTRANLSNTELAEQAQVGRSVVGGCQSGKRVIGEHQATKLATALGLQGDELKDFVLCAIDSCTEKVLLENRGFPATLLNMPARQLSRAGIQPEQVIECRVTDHFARIKLNDGREITFEASLVIG